MGKRLGAVMDGVQSTTENVTEIRSNGITVNQADSSGLTGHISATQSGIFRNPASINSAVEITANENAVMAGPVTIGSSGTLTVNGTLVIV
jgi:hypothetical protein